MTTAIGYFERHNPQSSTPTDIENRRLCWVATHGTTEGERLAARNELILKNQRLIVEMALVVSPGARLPLDDLISEGVLALARAVDKFDPGREVTFSTYACRALIRRLRRAAWRQQSIVAVPCYLGFPNAGERHAASRDRALAMVSLDATDDDDRRPLSSYLEARDSQSMVEDHDHARRITAKLMRSLSPQERRVVRARIGLGTRSPKAKTFAEIGAELGVTQQRASYVWRRAIGKLRGRQSRREGV